MAYAKPVRDTFDPLLWADNKTAMAEAIQKAIIDKFIQGYDDFWGVENGTSKHTKEEMQRIIDVMPAALDIMIDAVKFKTFANTAFPGALADKYHTGVFVATVGDDGKVTIGDLNEAWVPAPIEEELNNE